MGTKRKMIVSKQATSGHRPSSAERRAAEVAWLSTQQADLKREAAERRAEREVNRAPDAASTQGI
jgi:hypothetical protein